MSCRSVKLLEGQGQEEDNELRDGLKSYSNWPTFPQIYVNGELIGGSDIVEQMYESGQLESLLETVQEN